MAGVATFRFYEELNDFLPPDRRKRDFPYRFNGSPSVKDAIEAIGPPHAEVDLILVNGEPVPFSCNLRDGDRVAVYPVFESLDIGPVSRLRPEPLREPAFILDVHLGRLARYLRLLGFDTLYDNDSDDAGIVGTATAGRRIILTRDVGLLKHGAVTHGYRVRATNPREQLAEVVRRFDLAHAVRPFTRCTVCNGAVVSVAKDEVLGNLKPGTASHYDEFHRCTGCGRVYWKGPHYRRMLELVRSIAETDGG